MKDPAQLVAPHRLDAAAVRYQRGLHRFARCLVCAVLALIVAGAMVTSTGSGLAVPDWPTTYGQNMFTFPISKWVGGIFYEHGHRLIASTVGLLTIIMMVYLLKEEPRRAVRGLGIAALVAVIAQGVLGGVTVLYLLPTYVSVAHGCLAQVFFCIVITIAMRCSRMGVFPPMKIETARFASVPALCIMMFTVIFLQLVIGAWMRHSGSGLAVTDFPLAYGRFWPDLSVASVAAYNHDRAWSEGLAAITKGQILLHMIHRLGGVLVSISIAGTSVVILRRHPDVSALRRPAVALLFLLFAQLALGAMIIWTRRMPVIASAHVALGAATLGTSWLLVLRSRQLLRTAPRVDRVALAVEGFAA